MSLKVGETILSDALRIDAEARLRLLGRFEVKSDPEVPLMRRTSNSWRG